MILMKILVFSVFCPHWTPLCLKMARKAAPATRVSLLELPLTGLAMRKDEYQYLSVSPKNKTELTNYRFEVSKKIIKVFWGSPGQNGRFWRSFLIPWHSQKTEHWRISMFGKVNPAPVVSKCVRQVCRSLLGPLKSHKTIKNDPKTWY